MEEKERVCLPPWLLAKEDYQPQVDNDRFLRKSIKSILHVLERFRYVDASAVSRNGHPIQKLITTFIFVLLVALTQSLQFLYMALAWIMVELALAPSRQLSVILKVSFLAMIINALVFLPSFIWLGNKLFWVVPFKLFLTVSSMQLFAFNTSWNDTIRSLRFFKVPHIFIFILHITLKYIFVLGQRSLSLLQAMQLRSVGRNHKKGTSMGALMGTLFLRSQEEAKALYDAMLCRGFTGEYVFVKKKGSIQMADLLAIVVTLVLLYTYWQTRGL